MRKRRKPFGCQVLPIGQRDVLLFLQGLSAKDAKRPPQQKKEKTTKEEIDLTKISKFEWKEKTCEDIIEDMRNMKKMLI